MNIPRILVQHCTTPLLALGLLTACGGATNPGEAQTGLFRINLDHGGLERQAVIYVPETFIADGQAPIMLNFHGYGGTADDHLQWADMRSLADRDGALLVYPQGSILDGSPHWNAALPGGDNKSTADDLGYVDALLDDIAQSHAFDPDRIYVSGYSNGAMMAFAIACYRADGVAAVASVSGTMLDTSSGCTPANPTSVIVLHGTNDGVLPYDGSSEYNSMADIVDFWVGFNNASPEAQTGEDSQRGIAYVSHSGGDGGTMVEHYRFDGGEHVWFETAYEGEDTNTLIWDFASGFDAQGAR